jgi:hypothetical protein
MDERWIVEHAERGTHFLWSTFLNVLVMWNTLKTYSTKKHVTNVLHMPELAESAVQHVGQLRRFMKDDIYRNVLLVPPGYPVWGRREVNQQVHWGLSAWRIQREFHPRTQRDS